MSAMQRYLFKMFPCWKKYFQCIKYHLFSFWCEKNLYFYCLCLYTHRRLKAQICKEHLGRYIWLRKRTSLAKLICKLNPSIDQEDVRIFQFQCWWKPLYYRKPSSYFRGRWKLTFIYFACIFRHSNKSQEIRKAKLYREYITFIFKYPQVSIIFVTASIFTTINKSSVWIFGWLISHCFVNWIVLHFYYQKL